MELNTSQGVALITLKCGSECRKQWTSSSKLANHQSTKESQFTVSNQLVFASVSANLGFETYKSLCEALCLSSLSEGIYYAMSKKYLSFLPDLAQNHFKEIRQLNLSLNDRYLCLFINGQEIEL